MSDDDPLLELTWAIAGEASTITRNETKAFKPLRIASLLPRVALAAARLHYFVAPESSPGGQSISRVCTHETLRMPSDD
jgi:hypothetical protein